MTEFVDNDFIDRDELLSLAKKVHTDFMENIFRFVVRDTVYRFREKTASFGALYGKMEPHWDFFFDRVLDFCTSGEGTFGEKKAAFGFVLGEFEKNQRVSKIMKSFPAWELDYSQQRDKLEHRHQEALKNIARSCSLFSTSSERARLLGEERRVLDKNIRDISLTLTENDYVDFLGVVWKEFEEDVNSFRLAQTNTVRGFRLKNN